MEIEYSTDEHGSRLAKFNVSDNKTVTMRELGGGDFRTVRKLCGRDEQMITDNLALYSLTEINGEKLVPVVNDMHLQSRASKLTITEYASLPMKYDEAFAPAGDEKND